jgi:hypothetical protein
MWLAFAPVRYTKHQGTVSDDSLKQPGTCPERLVVVQRPRRRAAAIMFLEMTRGVSPASRNVAARQGGRKRQNDGDDRVVRRTNAGSLTVDASPRNDRKGSIRGGSGLKRMHFGSPARSLPPSPASPCPRSDGVEVLPRFAKSESGLVPVHVCNTSLLAVACGAGRNVMWLDFA